MRSRGRFMELFRARNVPQCRKRNYHNTIAFVCAPVRNRAIDSQHSENLGAVFPTYQFRTAERTGGIVKHESGRSSLWLKTINPNAPAMQRLEQED
jgi:hypothetical protein